MSKDQFVSTFACQFCAAWAANHYDDYCSRGMQEELEKPPVEDALFLAIKAWEELQRMSKATA